MAERGIGRGLAAILPSGAPEGPELRELPVELIRPNPRQPRTRIPPETLKGLAESIAAAGLVQPLLVRPLAGGGYELIAGERRWRAAREAGLATVPAVVGDGDEARRLEMALVENVVREDLSPVDEARACAALVEELGLSKEELARRLGRSRAAISNLIRLLDLPDAVLGLIESGELSEGHGRAILQVPGVDARRRLAREAAAGGWSVRQTERRARQLAGGPERRRGATIALHPDQEAARARAEDLLGAALGADVRVRIDRRGVHAEARFADLQELLSLAEALGRRRAA